jgi:type VI secretion system secreted protein VgrG
MQFSQADRSLQLAIDGSLSEHYFPVVFDGREAVSEIPRYTIDVYSDELTPQPNDLLGHKAKLTLKVGPYERHFSGVVISMAPGDLVDRKHRAYQLVVMPSLYLATLNAACRSFVNMSALDIVTQVLQGHQIQVDKAGSRDVREYCLQYCESDFNFVARVLEEEGYYFYLPLEHDNEKLTLVDGSNGSFEAVKAEALEIGPNAEIRNWRHVIRTVPQQALYAGYDFEQFKVTPANTKAKHKLNYVGDAKVEGYPAISMYKPRADFFSKMEMDRLESPYEAFTGSCEHPNMAPGGRFQLSSAEQQGDVAGQSFVLLEVTHRATCYTHFSGEGGASSYDNSFTCIPLDAVYRPPLKTPRPVIHGVQTAVVSSDPDEYGRVKVKFHWGDELESWWARVAMPWAHKQMGFQFFPRTGSEVVVQFLEGNPERPLIVGAVFNGVNKPVYTVPDNKTQSGIRGTDPDKTGKSQSFNELQFEDDSGNEFIFFFAQKDMNRIVVNNDTIEIRQGNRTVTIKQGNLTTTLEQGNETHELKMGNLTTKLDMGAASTEAMQSIELKVGQNSIKIDQTGVTIQGMMVNIQGQIQTQVQGTMTQISGDAMLQLSGGITMIG